MRPEKSPATKETRRGTLLVLSAPSGAGKTTLVKALLARDPSLRFSISYTTRPPRPGETDGKDYCFVDRERFRQMVAAGEFLEHAEVFGNFYGTSKAQVEALIAAGHDVLLEIDWQGARQIRANAPACRTVFIMPPSVTELDRRLRTRATDSDEVIRRRLGQALDDMSHWAEFDFVVVNEVLDDAVDGLVGVLQGRSAHLAATAPATAARARQILQG
ncbi:MAG: guanylate kinase [Chromatiales bacterium]|nr:guanylate kinase [Chromatiales bacterium]